MQIGVIEAQVKPTDEFIVPGDTPIGAAVDLARTIVRRAERRLTGLYLDRKLENSNLLRYLNRLSSLCFVLELFENQQAGDHGDEDTDEQIGDLDNGKPAEVVVFTKA